MEQKLMAIWKYDQPPYHLAGVVKSFETGGTVTIEGYGAYRFTPEKILSYEEGIAIKEKLEKLGTDFREHLMKLQQELKNKVDEVLQI